MIEALILGMAIIKGVGIRPQARPDNCAVRDTASWLRIDIDYNSPNYYFRLLPRLIYYATSHVTVPDKSHSIFIVRVSLCSIENALAPDFVSFSTLLNLNHLSIVVN